MTNPNPQKTGVLFLALAVAAAVTMTACQVGAPGPTGYSRVALNEDGGGAQFESTPGDNVDPFAAKDPPPAVASRLHSCQKIPYAALGNLLTSRGVNLGAVAANGQLPTAGQLYKLNAATLGAPNYALRTREAITQTTSGETRLMDVFLMAAPEIVAAMPSLKACQVSGTPARMFDNNGACTATGITCISGTTATQAQVDLCNAMLKDVPGPTGQRLAVAAIMSAAHTCE